MCPVSAYALAHSDEILSAGLQTIGVPENAACATAFAMGMMIPLGKGAKGVNLLAGKISGYTKHGLNQAISREGVGVASRAILDAVRNPIKVVQGAKGAVKYVGKDATVVLSADGKVITTYPRGVQGLRNP